MLFSDDEEKELKKPNKGQQHGKDFEDDTDEEYPARIPEEALNIHKLRTLSTIDG